SITLDGYHNNITDKIIALPTKNTFVWSMLNLGKVNVDGFDLTAETSFYPWEKIAVVLGTTYTYLRAINVTNPTDGSYNHQLPYTPRVSGSGKAAIETPWLDISYSLLWSGHRYSGFQNYAENRLPGYSDHSISFSRSFRLNEKLLNCSFELLNLFDKNYAIIAYFPMPGRSFRATISLKF
ncbi:MAG: TonB-dependent receptor domain-containing protein, partial [Paludibacter sp.]